MKTMNFFRLGVIPVLLTLFVSFSNGQERPGIECGCGKIGDYIKPATEAPSVTKTSKLHEGTSSKGKYKLIAEDAIPPDIVNISIFYQGKMIFNESSMASAWGFSPDEDRFEMHGLDQFGKNWCRLVNLNPDPGIEGEQAVVYTVTEPVSVTSASILFSPHGKYLVYAAIDYQDKLFLRVIECSTGHVSYENMGSHIVGSPSGKSTAGWGFSPDIKDATFIHSFLTDVDQYSVFVKNLSTPDGSYILQSSNNQGDAYWAFSPCGDYFAWVYDSPVIGHKCRHFKTDGTFVTSGANADNFKKLYSAANGHYILYQDNSAVKITDNTASATCPDNAKPTWVNALLETTLDEGTKIGLHWDGAIDNVKVTSYEIYQDTKLLKEIEESKSYTVEGLTPNSSYLFRIEAGDESGNWSTDGPEKRFFTKPDLAPTWPNPVITPKGITETKITLTWNAANDDYGIEFYRIYKIFDKDTIEVKTVNGDILECQFKRLKASTTYTFLIRAGDAAGHWTTGPELIKKMPDAEPPSWLNGAALSDSANTETSLIVKWPVAHDNFNELTGYEIIMNSDTIARTKYNTHEYLVTGLEEGTVYQFEVIAVDESGGESQPLKASFSTLSSYVVEPLIKRDGNQKRPDISGNLVVWWDNRNDDGDIYSYNLETETEKRVTTDPHVQWDPAVSGERIVWTDNRNDIGDIYMYDPVLGEVPICTAPGLQDVAAIDGDIIVWQDFRNGKDYDIYMYDIKTGKESPVCTRKSNQKWPDVSGNYIVYADDRNGNWDIFMYSIYDQKETSICTNPADQTYPVISGRKFSDLAIAYEDNRGTTSDIYIYYPDLSFEQSYEYLVPVDKYPVMSGQHYPHLKDNLLVYQDNLGGTGQDWNIYAFQLTSQTSGKIKTIYADPLDHSDQTRPRTSKGNIVWQDERNGNSDIYIWRRPASSDLQLSVKESPDPAKVGDTLKYVVSVLNNGPKSNRSILTECTLPLIAKFVRATADKGNVQDIGKVITWSIDSLRADASAKLEIVMVTIDLAVLEFDASTKGGTFDPLPANNSVKEFTKVRNVVSSLVGNGSTPSLVTEPNGRVHLLYFQNDSVMYATKPLKGKWDYKHLDECIGNYQSYQNDMILDHDGNLQVVMSDYIWDVFPKSRLYHGTLTKDGQWSKKIIAISDTGFHSLSLKTDSKNELHLTFQQTLGTSSPGPLKEMNTVGRQWSAPLTFSAGYCHVDMSVDKNDDMQVSYYHLGPGLGDGLLYQKKSSSGIGKWNEPEIVEPNWRGGQKEQMVTSIVTDDSLNPHISYVGNVNNDNRENIKYAHKTNGRWNISMVDIGGFQSSVNEILLDPSGKAHFSYISILQDYSIRDIRYATNIAGPWIKQIVEENTGAMELDMGRDSYKNTHLVYSGIQYDSGIGGLQYVMLPPVDYFNVNPEVLDFGAVDPNSTKKLVLKLTNPSAKNISIDSLVINDSRFSLSKTSFILNRYGTDSVDVYFKQTQNSKVDTYLRIWYNVPSGLFLDVPIKVKSWQPELAIQDPVDFGDVTINTLATKTVSLQNNGTTDLIVSSVVVKYEIIPGHPIATDFLLVGHNCSTLAPGQKCDVQISFNPKKSGMQMSYLIITSNDPTTPVRKVTIIGNTPAAQLNPGKASIDFGFCSTGQTLTDTLILYNTGDALLNITGISLSGTDMDQFSLTGTCISILPGDSCVLHITMKPTRQADFQATLSITSNSQWSELWTIPVTGTSNHRTLTLSAKDINFGNVHVGEKSYRLLKLQNNGTIDVTVNSITLTGSDFLEFRHNSLCSLITAGNTCTDTVWFIPLFEGPKSAIITISSNDSDNPEQTVTLTGQAGTILPLQVSLGATPQSGQEPLNVQFQAVITDGQPPYFYIWDFDDLTGSTERSPAHEFTGFGVYNVSLKVSDVFGNSVTTTTKIAVTAEGVPVVIAGAQPDNGEIPLNVQFNTMVTGGDAPLSFLWEFRDGSTSNLQNPLHTYASPGVYKARITVTDNDGDKSRDSVLITARWNNSIAGQLWDEAGSIHISKSKVVLYPQTDINDTTLLMLDGSYSYLFPWLQGTSYTIQAVPDTVAYPGELPTYFGDKIALYEASWIQASGHITGKDIRLVKKPNATTGSGSISGDLVSGTKKGLSIIQKTDLTKGAPLTNIRVYLKSATDGKLKAYGITGSDGSFIFKDLENGSYYLVVDYLGKPMDNTNTPLVINDSEKSLEILAIVGIDKITVSNLITTIEDRNLSQIRIYPVPAKDNIVVEISEGLFNANSVRMKILDLSGKYVFIDKKYELKGSPVTLNIDYLNDGMYLLEVADNNKSLRVKIVKMK